MTLFNANVGPVDRAVRIIVGLTLLVLTATETIGLWGLVGLVPLATGVLGSCPAYSMLGVNTCATRKSL